MNRNAIVAFGVALFAVAFRLAGAADGTAAAEAAPRTVEADVVVYGGTSAGVVAAVRLASAGRTVVLVSPDRRLGGMTSAGLGFTDSGAKDTIGGLSREFYRRVWVHYRDPAAWRWEPRERFGDKGQGTRAIDDASETMWTFEPSVAEKIFDEWAAEAGVRVFRDEWLDRESGVEKVGARIRSIRTLSGTTYRGAVFFDATYEGDLMAAAGVEYRVGREANSEYDEEWNGVQTGVFHHDHHFGDFDPPISAYRVPGDPASGLLPRISPDRPGEYGSADGAVQAYCYRMCLTNVPENRVPFPRPAGYDPAQYELLLRIYERGWRNDVTHPIPNGKTDTNNRGPFSTDNIGYNHDYPEASYERRREILAEHASYQQGLMYFMANDPRVPEEVRETLSEWGLAADEFADNGNWPDRIYVREARRMVGAAVATEHEILKRRPVVDSVGMGSYTMDSHNVRRYADAEGNVHNEGDIGVSTHGPYSISLGTLLPKREQCENLLVPVCVSATHIAFGSIRMEPVFMILGHSAAVVADLALADGSAVQDVPYRKIRERLLAEGQVLETANMTPAPPTVRPRDLEGVVVDDDGASYAGVWPASMSSGRWVGRVYRHDGGAAGVAKSATFRATLPRSGRYEVRMSYSWNPNRAPDARVEIRHAGGTEVVRVDQTRRPPLDDLFVSLGVFEFDAARPASVVVSNAEGTAKGHVVADAVQWIPRD